MFIRQQRVLAASRFLARAIHDALRGVSNLARRDIEIFYVHVRLRLERDRARPTPAVLWPRGHIAIRYAGGRAARLRIDGEELTA
jgi:hypothetical protein